MRAVVIADGRLGLDAARCAAFYACRNDWRPQTRALLLQIASALHEESEAIALAEGSIP